MQTMQARKNIIFQLIRDEFYCGAVVLHKS